MQNKKNWLVAFLIILGVWATAGYGQQVTKIQAWHLTDSGFDLEKIKTLIDPDPSLPQPAIKDSLMREFTKGNTNTVEWSMIEIEKAINDASVEVKFFEIKAEYQKDGQAYLLWGIVNSPDSSATFTNLPEYVKISYYLRYFVQDRGKAAKYPHAVGRPGTRDYIL